MQAFGWDRPDVILGYWRQLYRLALYRGSSDRPCVGRRGFPGGRHRAADVTGGDPAHDIRRLGEPALFWGVTGGSVDPLSADWTAAGKKRRMDDYTPGGRNNRRPDRRVIVYANLI